MKFIFTLTLTSLIGSEKKNKSQHLFNTPRYTRLICTTTIMKRSARLRAAVLHIESGDILRESVCVCVKDNNDYKGVTCICFEIKYIVT